MSANTHDIDIHDCADEQIQYPGAIQPHGYLISCVLPDWSIRYVSANIGSLLDVDADSLIGQSLAEYLTEDVLRPVVDIASLVEPGMPPVRAVAGNVGPEARLFEINVHIQQGLVHLELEPAPFGRQGRAASLIAQSMISRIAAEERIDTMHQRAVEQLRELIAFDRVLVYKFRPDGAGQVIAEARVDDIAPLMGLRFPESDIPAQARALYVRNRIRLIPDTAYTPSPVLPPLQPGDAPLDMSTHLLRSVSQVHMEYSRNMGVAASMSISLVSGGKLWGLIACHHREPRYLPTSVRAAAELFGLFLSMRVSSDEQKMAGERDEGAREVRESLWRKLASTRDLDRALADELPQLAQSMECDGVVALVGGTWHAHGSTPVKMCESLRAWLSRQTNVRHTIACTQTRTDWCVEGACDAAPPHVAGVLALPLGQSGGWLLFFRDEQVESVDWAGEPVKAVESVQGRMVLKPRERFEAWREVIHGRSLPWNALDRRTAERLLHLLDEFRVRARHSNDEAMLEFDANLRRKALRDQRSRLEQLSSLLDGLVHLDEADTARLAERISLLEAELRALVAATPRQPEQDPGQG